MTGFLQFSRCFPQINGCGDSAHFPPLEDALVSLALLTRKRVGCDTMKSGDRRRYLMVIHTFRQLGQTSSTVFTLVVWRHSSPTTHKILLYWAGGRSSSMAWGNVVIPLVGILTGQMMFRTNEISVLSLLRFYLQ
ncbi:hypothetical protein GmHk_18G051921 [Glycine max]|nr:hypothetical protein GmHk_18G051921 [Glycine max]